jgi:hypothetical protein
MSIKNGSGLLNTPTVGGLSMTTNTQIFDPWSEPHFIKVEEVGESIEFIYKQTSMITFTYNYPSESRDERVFKIVFSCEEGKWHKSAPIYGKIFPAIDEDYEFD